MVPKNLTAYVACGLIILASIGAALGLTAIIASATSSLATVLVGVILVFIFGFFGAKLGTKASHAIKKSWPAPHYHY